MRQIYDEAAAEMDRAVTQMSEEEAPSAADLITHMKFWFAKQLTEREAN